MSDDRRGQGRNGKQKIHAGLYRPTYYFLVGLGVMALGITLVALDRVI